MRNVVNTFVVLFIYHSISFSGGLWQLCNLRIGIELVKRLMWKFNDGKNSRVGGRLR